MAHINTSYHAWINYYNRTYKAGNLKITFQPQVGILLNQNEDKSSKKITQRMDQVDALGNAAASLDLHMASLIDKS